MTARVGALASIFVGIAGIVWQYLETAPPRLGFDDTDDPALMVSFIRQHPEVFAQAGIVLVLMAVALTIAVLVAGPAVIPGGARSVRARTTTAFGLYAAGMFLLGGGIRVGSSGPLLHMADISSAAGEAAYTAAQVASQGVFIAGIFALCLWAVGLSVIGLRTRSLPWLLCLLAILPGYRIAGSLLGPLNLLPAIDLAWILGIASIAGTFVWCLLLGVVLMRRGRASVARWEAQAPASSEAANPA